MKRKSSLSVPEQHQLKIAYETVKNPMKGRFLGGPTEEEAKAIIEKLGGRSRGGTPK
jgi:hypothetical protein